jgi:hypothetical protein
MVSAALARGLAVHHTLRTLQTLQTAQVMPAA